MVDASSHPFPGPCEAARQGLPLHLPALRRKGIVQGEGS